MGQPSWSTLTKPDIAAAVRILATFSNGYDDETHMATLDAIKWADATWAR